MQQSAPPAPFKAGKDIHCDCLLLLMIFSIRCNRSYRWLFSITSPNGKMLLSSTDSMSSSDTVVHFIDLFWFCFPLRPLWPGLRRSVGRFRSCGPMLPRSVLEASSLRGSC